MAESGVHIATDQSVNNSGGSAGHRWCIRTAVVAEAPGGKAQISAAHRTRGIGVAALRA